MWKSSKFKSPKQSSIDKNNAKWKARLRAARNPKKAKSVKQKKNKLPYETPAELKSMSYAGFLKSKYWALVRKLVLERDGNACRICKSDKRLEIHHDSYNHHFDELRHREDLLTLCRGCHKEHHYAQM